MVKADNLSIRTMIFSRRVFCSFSGSIRSSSLLGSFISIIMLIFITFICLNSNFLLISGQEKPKVNPFGPFIKPVIGGKTSFTCQSLSGSPPLHVSWFKDGNELTDSVSVRIQSNADPSMLIIDSIQSSHSGNYSCKISNRFGYDTFTTELLVEGPPNWIEKPKDIKSHHGETIIVNCKVSGHPKPRIQWKKLTGPSWKTLDDNFMINMKQSKDKLIIGNSSRSVNGKYGCAASNGVNPDLWSEFDVTIEGNVSHSHFSISLEIGAFRLSG
ncbi:cell adhesion molecule DSCAM-like isoform X1 [Panonychus citri]|uniref:cell adhesion molecule DSCAM-like isoform X1 n=1 Tax=Panonychus citri TaxID=50023 RepID=UPI0023072497|nr:cell adhesion molecule DSCAM-like isoform X1 [Panonychus citri]